MGAIGLDDFANAESDLVLANGESLPCRPIPRMLISECLRLYDTAAILATGSIAYALYVLPGPRTLDNRYPGTIALGALVAAIVAQLLSTYRLESVFSRSLGVQRAVAAWLISFGLLVAVAFGLKLSDFYSRVWAISWLLSAAGSLLCARYLLSFVTLRWAKQGRFAFRTLIVGVGEQADMLAAHIAARGDSRTRIVAFVDDRSGPPRPGRTFHGHAVIPDLARMMVLIRQNAIDEIIIALPWNQAHRVQALTMQLATTPVRIRLAPDLAWFCFADRRVTMRAGVPMLTLFDRPISGWSHALKLIEDRVIALSALLFVAPLMISIGLAIKLDSRGPVLFKQSRFGFNDRPIEVWKFRTMRSECTDANALLQATRRDPRVTRVGRFLRKSSLDELPQLFNVLKGEMSIVGPRPHAMATKSEGKLFQDVVDRYAARHRVNPGITGWAQVNGWRGETDTIDKIQKRVEFDLYYIDNWSVWFDLYIVLRTFIAVFRTRDTY
jgi:Undecaprenyl-phosphate glucose phosphotransferase